MMWYCVVYKVTFYDSCRFTDVTLKQLENCSSAEVLRFSQDWNWTQLLVKAL